MISETHRLYVTLAHIRDRDRRRKGESIDAWAARTWQQALREHGMDIEQQKKGTQQ